MDGIVFWDEERLEELSRAGSFSEIGAVALAVMRSMPGPIMQVCGPLSTGGEGEAEKNLAKFRQAIAQLSAQGHVVFNQLPLENVIRRVRARLGAAYDPYELLNAVYLPLFASALIREVYFLQGWESSQGARWEFEQAQLKNISIRLQIVV